MRDQFPLEVVVLELDESVVGVLVEPEELVSGGLLVVVSV